MDYRPIPVILDLHAEEAAVLWLQRAAAVNAPHFSRYFLSRLDERLEANIDGLREAGRHGWEVTLEAWKGTGGAGELFALAALAFGAGSQRGMTEVLTIAEEDKKEMAMRPIVSALGWLEPKALKGLVQPLLDSPRPVAQAVGLGACSVHRVDPGDQLGDFLADPGEVGTRALRLAGELGREDLRGRVLGRLGDSDPATAFRAAWASVLLGDRGEGLAGLRNIAAAPGPYRREAFDLAILAMQAPEAKDWLKDIGKGPGGPLLLVRAAGLMGQSDLIPWVIRQMEETELSRQAGESFSMITGAELDYLDLDRDEPEDAAEGPNDDPDNPLVDPDADADLPWPDPALVETWWAAHADCAPPGRRSIRGQAWDEAGLNTAFRDGFQRQRRAAAFGLSLLTPGAKLPSWKHRIAGPIPEPDRRHELFE